MPVCSTIVPCPKTTFAGEKGDADARWRLADFVKRHGLLDLIADAVAR